jgi:putative redox protein
MATPGATEIVVFSREGLQQEIWAGGHTLLGDEPVADGGRDSGPNPYELLLGALGACTSMTLLLYARRKGWELQHVEVRLCHDRIYAEDCAECETRDGRIDRIAKEIVVAGNLDEAQVQRLGEIAARCPVNQTLTHEIHMTESIRRAG